MNVSKRTLDKWDKYIKLKNGEQKSKPNNKPISRGSRKA